MASGRVLLVMAITAIMSEWVYSQDSSYAEIDEILEIAVTSEIYGERYFMITAYYSPVPGQRFYIQGSYEDDVRLNGEGKYGASWASVRPGMIAAPSSLPFGTKIDLAGYWVGTVLDRWGAIVDSGENGNTLTRLDLWVGTGEEGLCRALRFGVQTAYGTVYDKSTHNNLPESINLKELASSCSGLGFDLTVQPETPSSSNSIIKINYESVFTYPVTQASSAESVLLLKKLLQELKYLQGPVNNEFDTNLSNSIYAFQKAAWVVSNREDLWAWYHWPKTRTALKDAYTNGKVNTVVVTADNVTSKDVSQEVETTSEVLPTQENTESQLFQTIINTAAQADDIRELQGVLNDLSYFPYDQDGIYNKRLVDAIYAFQKSENVVTSPTDVGAWYFWPKTRAALEEVYKNHTKNKQRIADISMQLSSLRANQEAGRAAFQASLQAEITEWITPKIGSVDPDVRALQKALIELGYMTHKDTAYFWPVSQESLAKFQLDKGLIDSPDSQYAWLFGKQTRAALSEALTERRFVASGNEKKEIDALESELQELQ